MGERELADLADLYVEYTPTVAGTPHPTSLVVTSTLRFATPPPSTDFLHHSILCNPAFSAPQLDAIALARQAHLKDRAFLLGDGTGVGKGRELAGMLMNHLLFHPSHRRFVFVTASAQLEADIVRDLGDIGWKSKGPCGIPVLSLQSFPPSHSIPVRRAILFMTYTLLRQPGTAKSKGKGAAKKSRLDQVLQWLDRGDGGMLVFDEIHAAKDIKTSTSQAVVALQDGAPKYKCAYASATACSSILHLGTMVRLGLWGPGSAFETREAFFERWHSQTRSGLELVSAEMAAQGLYVARRLSFSGTDFAPVTVSMTPHDLDLHRRLCVWFLRVSKLPDCFVSRHQKARLWSSHLTFFKALLVAFRVRACAQLAKQAVDEGGSVVISLIGTGEAAAKRMIEEADDDVFEDGFVALQETLKTVIELAKCDGDGTVRSDFPVAVTELEKQIDTFELPPSPLDLLIHELTLLGHGAVAEMTGRVGGFYKDASIDKWRYCKRTTTNLQECNKFQAGDAKFAVISSAASTGCAAPPLAACHSCVRPPPSQKLTCSCACRSNAASRSTTTSTGPTAAARSSCWSCRGTRKWRCSSLAVRTDPRNTTPRGTSCSRLIWTPSVDLLRRSPNGPPILARRRRATVAGQTAGRLAATCSSAPTQRTGCDGCSLRCATGTRGRCL